MRTLHEMDGDVEVQDPLEGSDDLSNQVEDQGD